jgi:epoxyqueuosine reductase
VAPTPSAPLADAIRAAASGLGFARTGFASPERFEQDAKRLGEWLAQGRHGAMQYMAGPADRADPRQLLAEVRTLIVCALPHWPVSQPLEQPTARPQGPVGAVASYALGDDYHLAVRRRLNVLAGECARIAGRPVRTRVCVGSAPLLERAAAARAGLGFIGQNTMTIVPGLGSRVLLGVLLADLQVAPDPMLASSCDACGACIQACPTGALVAPYVLDATRCVSYLTIELGSAIPRALRPLVGTRVFGCDACQQACPFNVPTAPPVECPPDLAPRAAGGALDLVALLRLKSGSYRRLVRRSALRRASRNCLARNAAVALGNAGDGSAIEALAEALASHPSPMVRGHAAWALGRLGGPRAQRALLAREKDVAEPEVRDEVRLALDEARGRPAGT